MIADTCCKTVAVYREDVARLASSIGAAAVAARALNYFTRLDAVRFDYVARSKLGDVEPDRVMCLAYRECYSRFSEVLSFVSEVYRKVLC